MVHRNQISNNLTLTLSLTLTLPKAVRIELFTVRVLCTVSYRYSSTRLIPKVAINYTVIQNERASGFMFKFVVQQRFEMNKKIMPEMIKNLSETTLQLTTSFYSPE